MKDWQDTVMSDEQIAEAFNKFYGRVIFSAKSIMPSDRIVVQAQSEISFKAGYDWARKEMNLQTTSLADLLLNHRKAGIKEVVEWIKEDGYLVDQRATNLGDIPVFLCHSEGWQAKLKEWGIE